MFLLQKHKNACIMASSTKGVEPARRKSGEAKETKMNYNDLLKKAGKDLSSASIINNLQNEVISMIKDLSDVTCHGDLDAFKRCLIRLFRIGAAFEVEFVGVPKSEGYTEEYELSSSMAMISSLTGLQLLFDSKNARSTVWSTCLQTIETYAKLKGMDISKLNLFEEA